MTNDLGCKMLQIISFSIVQNFVQLELVLCSFPTQFYAYFSYIMDMLITAASCDTFCICSPLVSILALHQLVLFLSRGLDLT